MYQAAHFSTFFRVINVDIRGYGFSDKSASATSIVEMAEDVIEVLRHQGAKEAIAAGISVGGVMALQLGLDHPDIFRSPILVGCSSGPGGRYQERIDGYTEGVKKYHIQHLRALASQNFSESKLGSFLLRNFTDWDKRLNGASIQDIFNALQNRDLISRLGELKMPVLVINGEFDNSLPRSREMSRRIAGAIHRMIPGTGHACCLEDPAAFDEIVIDFLKTHGFVPQS